MPVSRPNPPSRLRQLAYQQHTALLGPDSDPEGWHPIPFVRTRGKLSRTSPSIEAKCSVRFVQSHSGDLLIRSAAFPRDARESIQILDSRSVASYPPPVFASVEHL